MADGLGVPIALPIRSCCAPLTTNPSEALLMANAYLLNGTVSAIRVRVNTGPDISLQALDLQTPSENSTAKLGLASSPGQGVLGIGVNEVVVTIGGITTTWKVEIGPPVTIALDVQLII